MTILLHHSDFRISTQQAHFFALETLSSLKQYVKTHHKDFEEWKDGGDSDE